MGAEPVKIVKTRRDAAGPGTRVQPKADDGWLAASPAAPSSSGGSSGDMTGVRFLEFRHGDETCAVPTCVNLPRRVAMPDGLHNPNRSVANAPWILTTS